MFASYIQIKLGMKICITCSCTNDEYIDYDIDFLIKTDYLV